MFRLCRRESGAPLGISAFGCFSTQCYRAHDDVHQLQTDSGVWCSCLQRCLWLPAKQSLGLRDLWCSVHREFSATYRHGSPLRQNRLLYCISYSVWIQNKHLTVETCSWTFRNRAVTVRMYLYVPVCPPFQHIRENKLKINSPALWISYSALRDAYGRRLHFSYILPFSSLTTETTGKK